MINAKEKGSLPWKVSIIMAAYNAMDYIQQSIQSVVDQTYQNWELIICDDASMDGTWDYLAALADSRIQLIRNKENMGASRSRNECLAAASGDFIAVLDADDIWGPEKLKAQISNFSKDPELGIIGTNVIEIDVDGNVVGQRLYPSSHCEIMDLGLWKCPMLHSSIMFKRSILIDGYQHRYELAEDWEMIMNIVLSSKATVLQKALVHYRMHEHNLTHTLNSQQRASAFLLVQKFEPIASFSANELEVFKFFFNYNNPPKRRVVISVTVLFRLLRKYWGAESRLRCSWFLKSFLKPTKSLHE